MPDRNLAGGRERARQVIARALSDADIDSLDHILGAHGTDTFLGGGWPTLPQIQKIEFALQWPYGTIDQIVHRPPYAELTGEEHAIIGLASQLPEAEQRAMIELLKVTLKRAQNRADAASEEADAIRERLRVIEGGAS